jgi:hypothetical protein
VTDPGFCEVDDAGLPPEKVQLYEEIVPPPLPIVAMGFIVTEPHPGEKAGKLTVGGDFIVIVDWNVLVPQKFVVVSVIV